MPDINQIIEAHRRLLLARDQRLLTEIGSLYLTVSDSILREAEALVRRIADARAAGTAVSPGWLVRERRLAVLLQQTQREMHRFSTAATAATAQEQRVQVEMASRHTIELLGAQGAIESTFQRLPTRAVEAIVGATSSGSPLRALFDRFGVETGDRLRKEMIQAVAVGQAPDRTSRRIRDYLDGNGARARTIARTETIRAYRESGRQTAQENEDVLKGWTWVAALNGSCPSCIAMHGTFHKPEERMSSHPNCRCAQRWETKTFEELGIVGFGETRPSQVERGADWFERQPNEVKREILGARAFDAYRAGKLKLEDFVGHSRDPRWGPSYFTRSLQDAMRRRSAFPGYPDDEESLTPPVQTSAPVTIPAGPRPAGTAISPKLKFGVTARPLGRVVDLIDRVHGDGELPDLPVLMNRSLDLLGGFHRRTDGTAVKITVSEYNDYKAFTLAHEIGHFLDFSGMGRAGQFASETEDELRLFREAIESSESIRKLRAVRRSKTISQRDVQYLLRVREIWARAYSQWLAVKTGDEDMLESVRVIRAINNEWGLSQWTDDDFAPIMKAIDGLFEKLGWIRRD